MTKYTGKNNFPQRHSSVYTESGKPFPAALTHILWKCLESAAGEPGCAETQRLFEALKTDLYNSAVCWERMENRASPPSHSKAIAGVTPVKCDNYVHEVSPRLRTGQPNTSPLSLGTNNPLQKVSDAAASNTRGLRSPSQR